MNRRACLRTLAWLPMSAAAVLGVWLSGCAGDSTTGTTTTSSCDGAAPSFMNRHFHATCVPQSVLSAPQASNVVAMLQTGRGHAHTLELTAAQVADIASGATVTEASSTNSGHTHQVWFN